MPDDQFRDWLLSQLKDSRLIERAKNRMEGAFDISSLQGSSVEKPEDTPESAPEPEPPLEEADEFSERTYEPDGFWIGRAEEMGVWLYRPAEKSLAEYSDAIFEHLASYANRLKYEELKREPVSEAEARFEGPRLLPKQYRYLYELARQVVYERYRSSSPMGARFYGRDALLEHLRVADAKRLERLAKRLADKLPDPTPEIYRYFGLTENGLERLWWDETGEVRSGRSFTELQLRRFSFAPAKITFLWKYPFLAERILACYDGLCAVAAEGAADRSVAWKNLGMRRFLTSVFGEGRKEGYSSVRYEELVEAMYRLAEERVRELFPGFPKLNIERELLVLRRRLPAQVERTMLERLESFDYPDPRPAELAGFCALYRSGAAICAGFLENHPKEDWLELLNRVDEETARKLLVKGGASLPGELVLLRVFLKQRESGKLTKKEEKELAKRVHPSQQKSFQRLAKVSEFPDGSEEFLSAFLRILARTKGMGAEGERNIPRGRKRKWAEDLLACLEYLKYPRVRKIELNRDKIRSSRKQLDRTVRLVEEFLDETEAPSPSAAEAFEKNDEARASEPGFGELEDLGEQGGDGRHDAGRSPHEPPKAPFLEALPDAAEDLASDAEDAEAAGDADAAVAAAESPAWSEHEKKLLLALRDAGDEGLGPEEIRALGIPDFAIGSMVFAINDKAYDDLETELILEEDGRWTADPSDIGWICERLSE